MSKIVLKEIARVLRTHGLDGAVVVQVLDGVFYDALPMLKASFEQKKPVVIDRKEFIIQRLFGVVKNVCRIKFDVVDMDAAKLLCGKWIEAEYTGFDYDSLISLPPL